jgi:Lon protease-like protein
MSAAMSASASAPSSLPQELPIFPLTGVVLLPRAKLPLNVFEPRYLAMIEDALAQPGRMIGIIQPNAPEDKNVIAPPIYKIGCAGRIVSFNETDDGRFMIGLAGVCRFEVAGELPTGKPYRRVRPDWRKFLPDLDTPAISHIDRKHLTIVLQHYFKVQNIDADWRAMQNTPDELLVSSLVMICPLAPNERQALLEAPDLFARAELLIALLEMASVPQANEGDAGVRH